jgi:hypothetical protein
MPCERDGGRVSKGRSHPTFCPFPRLVWDWSGGCIQSRLIARGACATPRGAAGKLFFTKLTGDAAVGTHLVSSSARPEGC